MYLFVKKINMKKLEFRSVLSIMIVVPSFVFLFLMLFVKVPKENEALINVISGAVLVGGVGAIIGFYFGSSKAVNENTMLAQGTPGNPISIDATVKEKKIKHYTLEGTEVTLEEYEMLTPEEKAKCVPNYEE